MSVFQAAPTALASFLASAVECVETVTIVLAVGTVRGWRSALAGVAGGLAIIAALIAAFGSALSQVPLRPLQLVVGMLLLLFGMRWLRKASLRSLGVIALHDEDAVFRSQTANLELARFSARYRLDPVAAATTLKAVVIEGLEVAFIVIAVSAGGPGLLPAALAGAVAACVVVTLAAAALRSPLARVPENQLKFAVGVILSAFGIFWVGEGLELGWPGGDWSILAIALALLLGTIATIGRLRVR